MLERLPAQANLVMDGTLGHGGHSQAMLQKLTMDHGQLTIVGVDRDAAMMAKAQERLAEYAAQMNYFRGSYADFPKIMECT